MKEFWYFLQSCWIVFWAGPAWRSGLIQYGMMAEEDWEGEGVEYVQLDMVIHIPEKMATTLAKRYDLEE